VRKKLGMWGGGVGSETRHLDEGSQEGSARCRQVKQGDMRNKVGVGGVGEGVETTG
jgi:hypothetical protein